MEEYAYFFLEHLGLFECLLCLVAKAQAFAKNVPMSLLSCLNLLS